jgi:hypothetical protein
MSEEVQREDSPRGSTPFWLAYSDSRDDYVPPQKYLPGSHLGNRPDVAHIIRRRCQRGVKS